MKKLLALLLALCLVCSLAACGGAENEAAEEVPTKTIMKNGFSIVLPEYAEDSSDEETAVNSPFSFFADGIYITALEQPKEMYGYDMTAMEYAQLLIDANGYDTVLEEVLGQPRFAYHLDMNGTQASMISTTLVTDSSFWFVSAVVETAQFDALETLMWTYLSSAVATTTGEPFVAEEAPTEAAPAEVAPAADMTVITVEDLTMQVPAEGAEDVTEEWDTGANLAYLINGNHAFMACREDKSTLGGNPDLESYAQGLIEVNGLDSQVQYHGEIPYFVFNSDVGEFTYIVAAYEGTEAMWYLQAYCAATGFEDLQDDMWALLETVSVA